jgi:hypothetical protein
MQSCIDGFGNLMALCGAHRQILEHKWRLAECIDGF